MARNGISCLRHQLRRAGVNIPRDADWPSADVPAPSEAPSPSSTRISAPATGSSRDDPLEIVPDSEDEVEVVAGPAPQLLTWTGPGRLVPILDQTILGFMADQEWDRRRINEEFAAGTLQAEETARRVPVPEYGGDDGVPEYRESPEL